MQTAVKVHLQAKNVYLNHRWVFLLHWANKYLSIQRKQADWVSQTNFEAFSEGVTGGLAENNLSVNEEPAHLRGIIAGKSLALKKPD